jgi:hypothetical protein
MVPRDVSLTPRDLVEKLDVLRVECAKCGRSGRYRVLRLAEQIGWDGKLTDWLYSLTRIARARTAPDCLTRAAFGAPTCRRWFEGEKNPTVCLAVPF